MNSDRRAPGDEGASAELAAHAPVELIGRIYDVAIDPERVSALVSFWTEQIEKNASQPGATEGGDAIGSIAHDIATHLDRTEELLKSALLGHRSSRESLTAWVQQKRHAAFAVTRTGQIIAANRAATIAFGINEDSSILDLTLMADGTLAALVSSLDATPRIARLRGKTNQESYSAVFKSPVVSGSDCVGVTADFIEWPTSLTHLLQATYRLTAAEIEVLQALMWGDTAAGVAEKTGRSIATLRTHIRSLITKTGTRSQMELLRLCLGLMALATDVPPRPVAPPRKPDNAGGSKRENRFRIVKLPDGRDRAYVQTGDPNGRPFLLFPSPLGLFRFPQLVESRLAEDGLRLLAPLRASLGPSSLPPRDRPVIECFATDCIALMDNLGIRRAPIVCIGMDLLQGVTLANMAPDRISAVIGAGPMLPVTEPEHLARLEPMARFIFTNTRSVPRITNIMTFAFLYMGHISGPARPLRSFLKASPIDRALLDRPEVQDAMIAGSPYNAIPNFAVHEACSREVEAFVSDWRDALVSCKSPVVLLTGDSSPWTPLATLEDFAARSPNIKPVVLADTGLMVAHQRPEAVFEEVKRWL